MKLGVILPTLGSFGKEGVYNRQELGLARALVGLGHEVVIWKYYRSDTPAPKPLPQPIAGVTLVDVPARGLGTHGLAGTAFLNGQGLDRLLVFSDNQMTVPALVAWARSHGVGFLPYIGTVTSDSRRLAFIGNALGRRNLKLYRRMRCFAKTPTVAKALRAEGVTDVQLMPVGLDTDRLAAHRLRPVAEARQALELPMGVPVVGFVGRLAPYKDPLALVEAMVAVRRARPEAWLMMVGDGPMAGEVDAALADHGLATQTRRVAQLSQDEMWQLYRGVDVLANFNPREIFGMALLEALYYGCPVAAVRAPGPELILAETPGRLVPAGGPELMAEALLGLADAGLRDAPVWSDRVQHQFTWDGSVRAAGLLAPLN